MTLHKTVGVALAVGTLLLGGCVTTSGMGGGELKQSGLAPVPLLVSWTSESGGITGHMVATLPNATYSGRFFEITRGIERRTLAPLWVGWPLAWVDWADPGLGPFDNASVDAFVTRYSGRVVAHLKDAKGNLMRCRLRLAVPQRGMSGGGAGECQIKGSPPIPVTF